MSQTTYAFGLTPGRFAGTVTHMTYTAEHNEYAADRSDWDDLGTMSDNDAWADGMADAAADWDNGSDWDDGDFEGGYEDAAMESSLFGDC